MVAITLEQAQAQLDAWLAASTAVARNQSYTVETATGRRQVTRADAAEIRQQIGFWEAKVVSLTRMTSGRSRTRYFVN